MDDRITEQQFAQLSDLIRERYGIVYGQGKREILLTRARKVIAKYNIINFDQLLYQLVSGNNQELMQDFANAITVNKTDFFREITHFEYILNNADAIVNSSSNIIRTGEIRAWSAACSTGEEPYSLAMVLNEAFKGRFNIKVLATDIDTGVLKKAQSGIYDVSSITEIPSQFAYKYFTRNENRCQVTEEIQELVSFRHFNLMEKFPFNKGFDLVFCRNVMIYFNNITQIELVKKIHHNLNPGGLLFTGHSETIPDKALRFKYVNPAVYLKL